MMLRSAIMALAATSILGNTTVYYDSATTGGTNSGAVNATLNMASSGIENTELITTVLNFAARVAANTSTASSRIADATASSVRDSCLSQGKYYCQSGGTCIYSSWRCDGVNDCLYNEDELGCTTTTSTTRTTAASSSLCGATLYGSGYVRSPNYPSYYDNYLRCNWTLVASPYSGYIVLQFYAFSTESCCDFLSIYHSNGTLLNRYSGTNLPSTMNLGSTALISFTTDSSGGSSGFSMYFYTSVVSATTLSPRDSCERQGNFYCAQSYECVPMSYRCSGYVGCTYGEDEAGCSTPAPAPTTPLSSSCGGTLYGSGYVRSPNYPSYYDNYLRCNWTLVASPYSGYIVLQFYAFSTESCCDFLSIYHSNGTLLNRYSGTNLPSTMNLGSTAFVSFTTDSYGGSSGFSMYFYTSVASVTTLSPRDSCERQGNFYCAQSNECIPMSYRCTGSAYCTYGEDEAGCSTPTPATTTPLPSSCGGTLYGSGYVRSPNYPLNYDNYLRCNWTLIASPYNGYIVLQFYAFNTESCCDFLSIYHSNGTLINRYSGTITPSPIVLGSYAVVSFTTDSSVVSSGFSIWFSTSVAAATTPSPRDSCEQQGYFYCAQSNLCIASWRRCDGYTYCTYGEDEAGCSGSSTTRTPTITPSQRDSCLAQGNFYCEFSRDCIAMWRRCDGYPYCYYGEDESGCGSTTATSRPVSSRPSASEQPQGSFIAASGFAQAFLQLSKSSAIEVHRGSWIVVSGYAAALLLRLLRPSVQ